MVLSVNTDLRVTGGDYARLRSEASANPYQGSLLSYAADGYAHELVAGEPFAGVCREQILTADAAASDGARFIEAINGIFNIYASVTGATGVTDIDAATKVYASDDGTLTTSSTGNSLVGVIIDYDGSKYTVRCATKHVSGALPA